MAKILDVINPSIKFELFEDNSNEVDGVNILGKVVGQFFCPDGTSRNGRFYPKALWETVIDSEVVKTALSRRLMFGTIGHDAELGDKGLREGAASHTMTKIWIEDNKGMGEALILNTPAGRYLNTYLRAKCQLYVSSRANGGYKGKVNGVPSVDPEGYELVGWDFVIDPGFLQANPSLAEGYNKLKEELNIDFTLGDSMDKTLVEHIMKENTELKSKVTSLSSEVVALRASNDSLFEESKDLKSGQEDLDKYKEVGTVKEIEELVDVADKMGKENDELKKEQEAFLTLGESFNSIKRALEVSLAVKNTIKEKFTSLAKIEEFLDLSEKFEKEVSSIGSLKELKQIKQALGFLLAEAEEVDLAKDVASLCAETGLSEDEVKELLKKHTAEEIKNIYQKVAERFNKKKIAESVTPVTKADDKFKKKKFNEDASQKIVQDAPMKTRIERMNERLARTF